MMEKLGNRSGFIPMMSRASQCSARVGGRRGLGEMTSKTCYDLTRETSGKAISGARAG